MHRTQLRRMSQTVLPVFVATALLSGQCRKDGAESKPGTSPAAARGPVSLRVVSLSEFRDVFRTPSDQVLVVNFWATWCPPCIAEMPDLVTLHRRYATEPVRFVTVSADKPRSAGDVLKKLREFQATTENYLLELQSDAEADELVTMVGNNWQFTLPATVVLTRGRKQVFFLASQFELRDLAVAIHDALAVPATQAAESRP